MAETDKQVKLAKAFDYYKPGDKMVSYPKGYEGPMPKAHYDVAAQVGALAEESKAASGAAAAGTTAGQNK